MLQKSTKVFIGVAIAVLALIAIVLYESQSEKQPTLPATQEQAQETPAEPASPARVFAADDLSNLAPDAPDVPVYDKHTLAERRAAGLPTALPDIAPYRTGKTVYLTFDDGPDGKNTPAVLDILKEAGVHATFYVTGKQSEAHPDVLQRIYDEGHAIGNHSYDHRYEKLYPDVNGFLAEMERTDEIIHSILGVRMATSSTTGTSARPTPHPAIPSRKTSSTTSRLRPIRKSPPARPSSSCTRPRVTRRRSRRCRRSSKFSKTRVMRSASSRR